MQWRIYDRQTLAYIDGGYAADYAINADYITDNNCTVGIISSTVAEVGDIIALIETAGAYHKGVVTAVDNQALTISYKIDKELFNDNIPNPYIRDFGEGTTVAGRFGLSVVAAIIRAVWSDTGDPYKNLPLSVTTTGDVLDGNGEVKMMWKWNDTSVNFCDWLTELFESYRVAVTWDIDFDLAARLSDRKPKYTVNIACTGRTGYMIKNNIAAAEIECTKEELPEKTVCIVLDGDSETYSVLGTFYLTQDANGDYGVTQNANDGNRMLPVRTTIVEYKTSATSTGSDVTVEDTARNELVPSEFNHSVEIKIDKHSEMFDFEASAFGDDYAIITADGRIDSVYTGRKESSADRTVTLCFGIGRRRYTDQMQRRLRRQRYTVLYRQN